MLGKNTEYSIFKFYGNNASQVKTEQGLFCLSDQPHLLTTICKHLGTEETTY